MTYGDWAQWKRRRKRAKRLYEESSVVATGFAVYCLDPKDPEGCGCDEALDEWGDRHHADQTVYYGWEILAQAVADRNV